MPVPAIFTGRCGMRQRKKRELSAGETLATVAGAVTAALVLAGVFLAVFAAFILLLTLPARG